MQQDVHGKIIGKGSFDHAFDIMFYRDRFFTELMNFIKDGLNQFISQYNINFRHLYFSYCLASARVHQRQ